MTVIRRSSGTEKSGTLPVSGSAESRRSTAMIASTQLTPWQRKVAQATPATPILKGGDKEDIDKDIRDRGGRKEEEGGAGIPERREDAGGDVVEDQKDQSADVDPQIESGVGEDLLRGADQPQQRPAEGQAEGGQNNGQKTAAIQAV